MELRQQATKGIAWTATQTWGARAFSFLITLVLARLLSPDSFGLVAFATVFISFAQIFLDQGFGDAIIQCQKLEREHLDTALWINILSGILLTAIGILVAPLIERIFNKAELAPVIGWLSLTFLIGSLSSVQQAILKRNMAFRRLALRSLAATIVSGFLAIIMAYFGFGVWSLVAKVLANSIVYVILLWNASDWRPGINVSVRHFKEIYRYGINIMGGNFVDFFSRNSDNFLIGSFLGTTALGYYTLAYNLMATMTDLLVSVPNTVIFPTFSRLQSESAKLKQAFYEVTQLQSIFAFPFFMGMLILAPDVIILLYGQKWSPSVPVTQVLMLMGILFSIFYFYGNVLKSIGKPSWRFGILSVASVLNIIGFSIAVHWGILAVALSYVTVEFIVLPFYFLVVRKFLQVKFTAHLQNYVPAFISSIAMVAVILGMKYVFGDNLAIAIRILILVPIGAIVYFLVLYLVKSSIFQELKYLFQTLSPRYK